MCTEHSKLCNKCRTIKCTKCVTFHNSPFCGHNSCGDCKTKSCSFCKRSDCCSSIHECKECKKNVCHSSCMKECRLCLSKACGECTKKKGQMDVCKKCIEKTLCSSSNCLDTTGPKSYKTCDHCNQQFCQNHVTTCQACKKLCCDSVKMTTLNKKEFCNDCFTKRDFIDFKFHDLQEILMKDDFRTFKLHGDFQGIPLIKVKENSINYPVHSMTATIIKKIKKDIGTQNPEITVSKSFRTLLNKKLNDKLYESFYPSKPLLGFSFEKLIILEKGESMKKGLINASSDHHIGHLFVVLPSTYQGGVFSFHVPNLQKEDLNLSMDNDLKTNWLCFYPHIEFEISKITSGTCMIMIYKIMNDGLKLIQQPKLDLISNTKNLLDTIFSMESIVSNGKLGFVLTNKHSTLDVLKSKDIFIFEILNSLEEYKVQVKEIEIKKPNNFSPTCECSDCVHFRKVRSYTFSLVKPQYPVINEGYVQYSEITESKPRELLRDDHILPSIYKHGILVIMKRKRKRGEEEEEDSSFVEINDSGEKNVKCPIHKCTMDEPFKSKVCGHVYDKISILSYLDNQKKQCPISGCNKLLSIDDMVRDLEMEEYIKNRPQSDDEDETPKEKKVEEKPKKVEEKQPTKKATAPSAPTRVNSTPIEVIVID